MRGDGSRSAGGGTHGVREWAAGQILELAAQLLVMKPDLTMETVLEEESGWENEPGRDRQCGPERKQTGRV